MFSVIAVSLAKLFMHFWHACGWSSQVGRKEKSFGEINIIITFAAYLNTTVVLTFGTGLNAHQKHY